MAVHFGLKITYGIPAPMPSAPMAPVASKPAPLWLASTQSNDLSSQWRLLGVVAQGVKGEKHHGLALLQDTQQDRARAYRVGQQLPGGATLVAVDIKTATLAFQGGQHTLNLETAETATTPVAINNQRGNAGNLPMPTVINAMQAPKGLATPERGVGGIAGRLKDKINAGLIPRPGAAPAPPAPAAKPQQPAAPTPDETEDD